MVYLILIGFYTYLAVKGILSYKPQAYELNDKFSPKITLVEFFILAVVISYLFNLYYLQQPEAENFVISSKLIWITFTACIFLLGAGIGIRFILDLIHNWIPQNKEIYFESNKKVYDVFSQIWVNLSILTIFFIFSLMEISRPIEETHSNFVRFAVFGLSAILGIIFYFFYNNMHGLVRKITVIVILAIASCLSLFVYETKVDFTKDFPVTISFIIFNIVFIITLLLGSNFHKKSLIYTPQGNIYSQETSTKYSYNDSYYRTGTKVKLQKNHSDKHGLDCIQLNEASSATSATINKVDVAKNYISLKDLQLN